MRQHVELDDLQWVDTLAQKHKRWKVTGAATRARWKTTAFVPAQAEATGMVRAAALLRRAQPKRLLANWWVSRPRRTQRTCSQAARLWAGPPCWTCCCWLRTCSAATPRRPFAACGTQVELTRAIEMDGRMAHEEDRDRMDSGAIHLNAAASSSIMDFVVKEPS